MSFKTFGANVYEACFNSLANTLNIFTLKEPAVAMYQMVICSCTIFDRCYVPETCAQQCFKCSIEKVQMSMISKCPRSPNVRDVQMSVLSKCPWCPSVHDVSMTMMWSHLSRVFIIVTCGHMWANLSQWSLVVTLVTRGHTGQMWSHWSDVVTLVTCGNIFHMWSALSHVVKNLTCVKKRRKWQKKICSHRPYGCAEGKKYMKDILSANGR